MARSLLLRRLKRLLQIAVQVERGLLSEDAVGSLLQGGRDGSAPRTPWSRLSRRRFMGLAGGSVLATLPIAQACLGMEALAKGAWRTKPGRIVIVGCGVAGLTAAYRLMQARVSCSLYEASDRLGGRMYTAHHFNDEGMFCERGGELVDTQHTELIALCAELGIGLQEIRSGHGGVSSELYFSRGLLRSETDVIAAFKPLAAMLKRDIAALTVDGSVVTPTYDSALARSPVVLGLDRTPLLEYLGRSGADRWLIELLSVAYVGEYGLEAEQQSALNLILQIGISTADGFKMFGASDESKRIQGGSDQLPLALAKKVREGAPITLGTRLLAIRDTGTALRLTFDQDGKTFDMTADRLVLSIPAPLLRDIDLKGINLSSPKRRAIEQWGFGTNAKFMLGFKKRVWNAPGRDGFVLYTGTSSQELWDTSRGQKGTSGIVTSFLGGHAGLRSRETTSCEIIDNLGLVYPGVASVFDGRSLLQHWPSSPFHKGSYTCPLTGQYTSIYGAFAEPELNGRLVFAGEHCSSDFSGFMNGAVASGNEAAKKLLG